MKRKKIAVLILLLTTISSFSQTEKGKIYIGANSNLQANFNSNTYKNDFGSSESNTNSFSISGQAGYFIINNLVIGADISTSFSNSKDNSSNYKSTSRTFAIAPLVKYYFSEKKLKPFIIAKYGFGSSNSTLTYQNQANSDDSKTSFSIMTLGGGISYFFNSYISVDLGLNYRRSVSEPERYQSNNKFTSSGLNSNVGFVLIF
jgi:outer membrane protein